MTAINRPGTPMSFFGAVKTSETSIRLISVFPLLVFQVEGNGPAEHLELSINGISKSLDEITQQIEFNVDGINSISKSLDKITQQIEFNVDVFTGIHIKSKTTACIVEFNFDLLRECHLVFPLINRSRVRVGLQWTTVIPTALMTAVQFYPFAIRSVNDIAVSDRGKVMAYLHDCSANWLKRLQHDAFDQSSAAWKALIQTTISALTLGDIIWTAGASEFRNDIWKGEWKYTMGNLMKALTNQVSPPSGFVVDFCRMIQHIFELEKPKPDDLRIEILGHLYLTMGYSTSSAEREHWIQQARKCYQIYKPKNDRVTELLALTRTEDAEQLFEASRTVAAKVPTKDTMQVILTDLEKLRV